jgi:hypothetical protein
VRRALLAVSVVCLLLISLPAHATDCPWPEAYDGAVDPYDSLVADGLKGNQGVHIIYDCATNVAPAHCAELNRQVNAYIQCRIAEARRQATTAPTRPTSQPDEQTVPRGELPSTAQMRSSSFWSLASHWPAAARPWQLLGAVRRAEHAVGSKRGSASARETVPTSCVALGPDAAPGG